MMLFRLIFAILAFIVDFISRLYPRSFEAQGVISLLVGMAWSENMQSETKFINFCAAFAIAFVVLFVIGKFIDALLAALNKAAQKPEKPIKPLREKKVKAKKPPKIKPQKPASTEAKPCFTHRSGRAPTVDTARQLLPLEMQQLLS